MEKAWSFDNIQCGIIGWRMSGYYESSQHNMIYIVRVIPRLDSNTKIGPIGIDSIHFSLHIFTCQSA